MPSIFHLSSFIFSPPSSDDLNRLLKAWRFWLLAALIGGALGALVYFIAPPAYRVRAVVQIDFNIEEAYKPTQDKQAFYYVEREVRKLMDLAYSDAVLQAVADKVGGVTVNALRDEKLLLSQPGDAGWHFFAEDRDPQKAAALASAWAVAFNDKVKEAASASMTLQAFYAQVAESCFPDCTDAESRLAELAPKIPGLESQIADLESRAQGISPYVESSLLQADHLTAKRKLNLSTYILVGAVSWMVLAALVVLFVQSKKVDR
jgi:uncharacterized protein involved in exopolysaccharide biosynthesis